MEIKRDLYLNRLIVRKHNGLIKVITGLRRSGKSYLLFQIFRRHLIESGVPSENIIEVAFDVRRNAALRDPDTLLDYIDNQLTGDGMYYILLDEVQLLKEFESVLNDLLHYPNVDVYVTGSNSKFLSSDIITEFRGRGDEVHVFPLSFAEYCSAVSMSTENAWKEYYTYGGLPLTVSMQTDEQKSSYLQRLFDEVYMKDITERNNVQNPDELNELINVLASSIGALSNPRKIADTIKSVKNLSLAESTVSKYIQYLEQAFLITRAIRFDIKGRKYIGTPSKFYFEDVGLRNARLHFRQVEENHIMENLVYNELRMRGFQVDVGVVRLKKATADGKYEKKQTEVDFVANLGSKRYYIQSAFAMPSPEKAEQETRPLYNIGDSFRKLILVRDNIKLKRDEKGVTTMGIYDFLLHPDSLDF